jgi:osmotically-inducible protein OsmY
MGTAMEKTDTEIKTQVLSELAYEPSIKASNIGVLVKNGTVTLNGSAVSYGEKSDVVRAAKRVAGVNGIADEIEVKLPDSHMRNDGDIAAAASNAITWATNIPQGNVTVTVRQGRIILEGEVEWWFQKDNVERLVQNLMGVKVVSNMITIKPAMASEVVATAISSAFERNALLDAKQVHVEIVGDKVILRGTVKNWPEREEAERAAWSSAGVFSVDNHLKVDGY